MVVTVKLKTFHAGPLFARCQNTLQRPGIRTLPAISGTWRWFNAELLVLLKKDCRPTTSVSSLIDSLGWQSLQHIGLDDVA